MSLEILYESVEELVIDSIRKEAIAQGHYLTGLMNRSMSARILRVGRSVNLEFYAIDYTIIVNEGIEPDKVSMKMLPGLTRYFMLRGVTQAQAVRAATLTIAKWKKEGMSTEASERFSSTGKRQHFIEEALKNPEIEAQVILGLDFEIEQEFLKTKSETV